MEKEINKHYWAIMSKELLVVIAAEEGYFACGDWEGIIRDDDLEILEKINPPSTHKDTTRYYDNS